MNMGFFFLLSNFTLYMLIMVMTARLKFYIIIINWSLICMRNWHHECEDILYIRYLDMGMNELEKQRVLLYMVHGWIFFFMSLYFKFYLYLLVCHGIRPSWEYLELCIFLLGRWWEARIRFLLEWYIYTMRVWIQWMIQLQQAPLLDIVYIIDITWE